MNWGSISLKAKDIGAGDLSEKYACVKDPVLMEDLLVSLDHTSGSDDDHKWLNAQTQQAVPATSSTQFHLVTSAIKAGLGTPFRLVFSCEFLPWSKNNHPHPRTPTHPKAHTHTIHVEKTNIRNISLHMGVS